MTMEEVARSWRVVGLCLRRRRGQTQVACLLHSC